MGNFRGQLGTCPPPRYIIEGGPPSFRTQNTAQMPTKPFVSKGVVPTAPAPLIGGDDLIPRVAPGSRVVSTGRPHGHRESRAASAPTQHPGQQALAADPGCCGQCCQSSCLEPQKPWMGGPEHAPVVYDRSHASWDRHEVFGCCREAVRNPSRTRTVPRVLLSDASDTPCCQGSVVRLFRNPRKAVEPVWMCQPICPSRCAR